MCRNPDHTFPRTAFALAIASAMAMPSIAQARGGGASGHGGGFAGNPVFARGAGRTFGFHVFRPHNQVFRIARPAFGYSRYRPGGLPFYGYGTVVPLFNPALLVPPYYDYAAPPAAVVEVWHLDGGAWHRVPGATPAAQAAGRSPQIWHRDDSGNWHQESDSNAGAHAGE